MSKKVLFDKESVLLNFVDNVFRFYNIKVVRLGYDDYEIVIHYGKLGNKGTRNVVKETNRNKAMAEAYNRYYDKKSMGYINKEDIMVWFSDTAELYKDYKDEEENIHFQNNTKNRKPTYKQNNHKKENGKKKTLYKCDLCHKPLKPQVYFKINNWARKQGNWDKDKDFIGYKKVLCINCQFKHDIFKKVL